MNASNLRLDGRLPCNTHGGQLSEAYIHGVNGIVAATRLVRGTSVNQPRKDINHALVTSGVGVPTGGALLGNICKAPDSIKVLLEGRGDTSLFFSTIERVTD